MNILTRARTHTFKVIAPVVALTCGLFIAKFSDADHRGSRLSATQPLPSSTLMTQSLESGNGLELVDGHWQFPGMRWTFQQSAPKVNKELFDPAVPDSCIDNPCELDNHLLGLIKSLMVVNKNHGNIKWYRVKSAELTGTAVTVLTGEIEIPVSIRFRWPAYGKLWTEVTAQRIPEQNAAAPSLLQLPGDCEIIATRVAADGSAQCHLISSTLQGSSLRTHFAAEGWNLDEPPAETGIAGLFWISSAMGRFEVSIKDVVGGTGCTAIVRPI